MGAGATYQLSGQRTFLAEATRQGSAYVGLLRILRENSVDEATTMKLPDRDVLRVSYPNESQQHTDRRGTTLRKLSTHMLNTLATLRGPEFQPAWYFSREGCSESANLPITGMVHLGPGRPAFFLW